ncbi:MAG: hypothetical protein ACXAD7_00075 [Candidatus Kariarchaeaceae archaeon]|jgi:hypothetical protein
MDSELNNNPEIHIDRPTILHYSHTIGDHTLYLHVVQFNNALFVSLYDKLPRLGSMTLAYPLEANVEKYSVFTGKNGEYADALAMIFAKKINKMVYGSVIVSEETPLSLELVKILIDKYVQSQSDPTLLGSQG